MLQGRWSDVVQPMAKRCEEADRTGSARTRFSPGSSAISKDEKPPTGLGTDATLSNWLILRQWCMVSLIRLCSRPCYGGAT